MTGALEGLEALRSRAQSRAVDQALIAAGVAGVLLMENAGRGAAEGTLALARAAGVARATVLAGPGNNGGDGLVLARHLALAGLSVRVFCLGDPAQLRGDAAVMRDAFRAVGGALERVPEDLAGDPSRFDALECDLLVDALFGTGLSRPLDGLARALVERANARASRPLSVALDLPSGLDADTGGALGEEAGVFRATHTFTFGTSKPGLHTGAGPRATGLVRVVSLGAPLPPLAGEPAAWLAHARPLAPRALDAHKGDNGHVLVVGGSPGKTGAALLSSRGAHRAGAGLVTIASRAAAAIDAKVLETMSAPLPADPAAVASALAPLLARLDAVVVGPGLGRDDWGRAALDAVLASGVRAVIDADALTLLGERGSLPPGGPRVVTPHPLEMARLLGHTDAAAVNADRLAAARECARRYHAAVVLKGAGTVVASARERAPWIAAYAEPALGVAGSGDVLTGAIAARLAERGGGEDFDARVLEAVLAHGRAGERVRAALGSSRGALAHEIADALPAALEQG